MDINYIVLSTFYVGLTYSALYLTADRNYNTCFTGMLSKQLHLPNGARLKYTASQLRLLRKHSQPYRNHVPDHTLNALRENGLLRYRGSKGGRKRHRESVSQNVQYKIPVLSGTRNDQPDFNRRVHRGERLLLDVPLFNPAGSAAVEQLAYDAFSFPRVYLLNASSIAKPHAIEQLAAELSGYRADVALITESHLKKHHCTAAFSIPGYSCIRRDRVGRRGGGVATFIKDTIQFSEYNLHDDVPEYETMWVRITYNNRPYVIANVYHPPNPIYNRLNFCRFLYDTVDNVCNSDNDITLILAGDFNGLSDELILDNTGLLSLVNVPTRGNNCLDRVYISKAFDVSVKVVKSVVRSDHNCVFVCDSNDSFTPPPKNAKHSVFRVRSPAAFASFLAGASNADFSSVFMHFDVQQAIDAFYDIVLSMFNMFFPVKHITQRDCDPPFLTGEVKSLLRKKNYLMRKGKTDHASAIAKKIGSIIARFNSSRLNTISSGSASMWKEVKRLTGSSQTNSYPPEICANSLNAHYQNISYNAGNCQLIPKQTVLPHVSELDFVISEQSVFNMLDKLKCTAAGTDELPFWFLKLAAPIISAPLTHIINCSVQSGIVPSQWKSAVIKPIPKVAKPLKFSDMRPISVVPILSRVTERLVVKELRPAFSSSVALANQFAYQPTCSTTAAIIEILSYVTTLLKNNTHVFLLTFDYSKAFDTISHAAVASSLTQFKIMDNFYNWIVDFLSGRQHCTDFQGNQSDYACINAGVIQGSVMGPTLFNLTASSLEPYSKLNKYFKYADDGYLVIPGNNASTIADELKHHADWATARNLKLNETKTCEMVISRKRSEPPPPTPGVKRVSSMKVLGVRCDDKLTFQQHISETIRVCSQTFFALRVMRAHGLNQKCLYLIFASKVLPKITYASPAWWGFLSVGSKQQLEAFLKRAIKFNYYPRNGPSLTDHVMKQQATLFNSIVCNKQHCLFHLLPPLKPSHHNTRTRGHNFSLPEHDDRNFISRCLYSYV